MGLLEPFESALIGRWLEAEQEVTSDLVCNRIDWLVNHHLEKIGTSEDGWCTLFTDPTDGRFWVLSYPQNHTHGGVPVT